MKKRFTDEQIFGILREAEVGAMSIKALCKKHNLTEQTFSAGATSSAAWTCPTPGGSRTSSPRTPGPSGWWPKVPYSGQSQQQAEPASGQSVQRYYDPQLGVFLSVDPVTVYDNPISQFHRYRYANNNPYR